MPEGGGPEVSPPGTATVSKHETGTPPGTAAVSKHETGTVAKQTAGALQFMVDLLCEGGVTTPPGICLTSLCPGRLEVRPR